MADEYVIKVQIEDGDGQPKAPTQESQTPGVGTTPTQASTPKTKATSKPSSTLKTIGIAGAMNVGSNAFSYALQQPTRSGNSNQQQRLNNGVELLTKLAIASTSPIAAGAIAVSMVVEAVTWKLNDNFRKEKESRKLNNAILRSGVSRNGRSRR